MELPDGPDTTDRRADRVKLNLEALDGERSIRGWSQDELAKRADLTANTIYNAYRSGWTSLRTFVRISIALDPDNPELMRRRLIAYRPEEATA